MQRWLAMALAAAIAVAASCGGGGGGGNKGRCAQCSVNEDSVDECIDACDDTCTTDANCEHCYDSCDGCGSGLGCVECDQNCAADAPMRCAPPDESITCADGVY